MKVLILTLGFDEKFCYRAILRHGISDGDKIILITARLVDKVRKAYELIKSFVERSCNVELRLVEVNVKDFVKAVRDVMNILEEFREQELIVNLSGGMRALLMVVLFALLLKSMRNVKLEIELEDFSGLIEIPQTLLLLPEIGSMGDERREILKLIAQGFSDVKSIAERLKRDESTVRRHISALEELGLIKVEKRKPLKIKATEVVDLLTA